MQQGLQKPNVSNVVTVHGYQFTVHGFFIELCKPKAF